MNGGSVSCKVLPYVGTDPSGCHSCRTTNYPGEWPASIMCHSVDEYMAASFDPDVVGPPGTCWFFTIADVIAACGSPPGIGVWWIAPFEALGLYRWQVPMRWIRANVIGTIGTEESFVHALSLNAGTDTSWVDSTILSDIAITVAAAFNGFMSDEGGRWTSDVTYREVGCSLLEQTSVGGDVDTILITEYAPINGSVGRSGSNSSLRLPNECSAVVTLDTGVRGRRGRGRFYLPPPASDQMAADGKFSSAFLTGVATNIQGTLLPALQPSGTGWTWAVRSGKDLALHDVTSIRMGNVPGSQRRRKRSQVDAYTLG